MYKEKIDAYFDDPARRQELIRTVSRLVGVKSVKGEATPEAPFGTRDYDHYVGLADLNDKETQLHILGHLDVVPEGMGWDTDPYTCVEKDGMLYGRGVIDDKGPVAAAMLAMKAVRDLGIPLSRNVKLVMGTDEESGSSDIRYYYSKEPYAPQSFTPDANFPLINVEKGHLMCRFEGHWEKETVSPRATG